MPDRPDGSSVPTEGLAAPAHRTVAGAGYATIEALAAVPATRGADLHGVGPNAFETRREALEAHGLSFRAGDRKTGGDATTWRRSGSTYLTGENRWKQTDGRSR